MADFASEPVNNAAIMGQAQGLMPNPMQDDAQRAQLQLAQAQVQQANQNIALQRIALQRQQTFGSDMRGFLQNPTAAGVSQLFGKYPEFEKQISDTWSTLDTNERRSTATQLGSVAALTAKGDYDGAAQLIQSRIDADKAAGRDPSDDQQMLSMLQSGDPSKQKAVLGLASIGAAGAVGPDKAGDFLKSLGLGGEPIKLSPGDTLATQQGQVLAQTRPNLTPTTVTNADGSQTATAFNPQTGAFGAAAADGSGTAAPSVSGTPGPAAGAPGGFNSAVAQVLHNEGGFNPSDMNGSPTMMGVNWKANAKQLTAMGLTPATFKNMTQDQAVQIYQGYWNKSGAENLPSSVQTPYFDVYVRNPGVAKAAWAQSGGDPAKFMQIASAYFQNLGSSGKGQKYAHAWANRDAINTQIATGAASGMTPLAPGAAPGVGQPQAVGGAPAGSQGPYTFGGSSGALNTKNAPQGYAWNASHTAVAPIPGSDTDPKSYSPQEIDDLARNWIATGPTAFASLGGGMGGGGISQLKKAALARATQMMAQSGITADQLPAIRSKYGALNTSMSQNTQTLNMLEASERVLHANAQQVLQTQQQLVKDGIIDNGSPALNNVRLETYSHVGSAQTKAHIKAYQDAVNGLTQEYTKFMNSANGMGGNAAPSDAARSLAGDLNDEGQGPASMASHIHQVFIETGNKRSGIQAQNQSIQQQLSSLVGGHGQSQQLPAGAKVIGTYHGKRVIEVNGQRLVEQ